MMAMMMMRQQPPILKNADCVSAFSHRHHNQTTRHSFFHVFLCLVIFVSQNGSLAWRSSSTRMTCRNAWKTTTTRANWQQPSSQTSGTLTIRSMTTNTQPEHYFLHRKCSSTQLQQASFFDDGNDATIPLIVIIALTLGVAANIWINQLVTGKQQSSSSLSSSSSSSGLGNFLRDGSGYNKSGFRLSDTDRALSQGDPLPWLKLPQLDFVSVAGQDEDVNNEIANQLESLRIQMNQALDAGNVEQATQLREELEYLMQQSGMEFRRE